MKFVILDSQLIIIGNSKPSKLLEMSDFIENSTANISSFEDLEQFVQAFNVKLNTAYTKYCDPDGSSTLVKPELPGYANIIYHLYTTGAITYSTGGKHYDNKYKIENHGEYQLSNAMRLNFNFGKKHHSLNKSYVILPVEQCIEFRKEMEQIIQLARSLGYFTEINVNEMVEQLNAQVIKSSMVHYPEGQYELVWSNLIKPKEAPSANTIYKLYSDGTISMEKGGNAYGQRSMFDAEPKLNGAYKYPFRFSNKFIGGDGTSYVILEHDECLKFRCQMEELISLFENSK